MFRISPLRIYEDFFESDLNVLLETELLDPIEPDCIVMKESLELLELRLLDGTGGGVGFVFCGDLTGTDETAWTLLERSKFLPGRELFLAVGL